MASFADFESAEPDVAARVRGAFDARRHKVLATLRADGSPRVSGIEASLAGGELWLAGMPGSVKFADLRRDPRMALHCGSEEPDTFTADAKASGRAVEADAAARARFAAATGTSADDEFELFHVELDQVVLTALSDERTHLVISSWRPGRGLVRTERT
jgi:pyridoxamine 5'-phosphate oxidase-like protein